MKKLLFLIFFTCSSFSMHDAYARDLQTNQPKKKEQKKKRSGMSVKEGSQMFAVSHSNR